MFIHKLTLTNYKNHEKKVFSFKEKMNAFIGLNGAGKTNILLAFEALSSLITQSGDLKDGDPIKSYEPYLLSEDTKEAPTRFEIEFYVDEVRYSYHIEHTKYEKSR